MNAASKLLLAIVAVLIVAAGGYLLFQSGSGDAPPAGAVGQHETPPPDPGPSGSMTARAKTPDGAPSRVETGGAPDPETVAQGVVGRVVGPFGNPARDVDVHLVESVGGNLLKLAQMQARGESAMILGSARTDAQGRFRIGVAQPNPQQLCEIRTVHPELADLLRPGIHVRKDEWYDIGTLELQRGAVVTGRVTIAGTGGPVPGAVVSIQSGGLIQPIGGVPGRERGIEATVDRAGVFRVENATPGISTVAAVAPGFARVEKQNVSIEAQGETSVSFELQEGHAIQGVVTDASGRGVQGALIQAVSMNPDAPSMGSARSGADGRFEIIGLLEGTYALSAVASGYIRNEENKTVQAGDHDVQIVLEKQGAARLRVIGADGRPVDAFELAVKTWIEGSETFGHTQIPPRRARHGADGYHEVTGFDPGAYVFQIDAAGYCRTFSDKVQVDPGGPATDVEVRLTRGGAIAGVVRDAGGRPLGGVVVESLPKDHLEGPLAAMFGGMVVHRATRSRTETDAEGRYSLEMLTPGTYQLRASHADYSDVRVPELAVQAGQTLQSQPITMRRGTLVRGRTTLDGAPAPQIKVTISLVVEEGGTAADAFYAEAISGPKGEYAFPKRLPPGRYQISAMRMSVANPFEGFADQNQTKREIDLAGQPQFPVDLAITTNRR